VIEAAEGEAAPVTMRALVETEFREGFLEIREIHGERTLNTGIEVLSPSNKRPGTPGWEQYTRKRQEFLDGAANFVEIDLLRGGSRMPMESAWPGSPYYLLVSRKREAPTCKVWPTFSLRPLAPLWLLPMRTSSCPSSRSSTRFTNARSMKSTSTTASRSSRR
jgi:hypothetical protein